LACRYCRDEPPENPIATVILTAARYFRFATANIRYRHARQRRERAARQARYHVQPEASTAHRGLRAAAIELRLIGMPQYARHSAAKQEIFRAVHPPMVTPVSPLSDQF